MSEEYDIMTDPTPAGWRVSDLAVSLLRTYVPVAVGAALSWLAVRYGLAVDQHTAAAAMPWVTGATIAAYYGGARWLERRRGNDRGATVARWLGRWMLGGTIRVPAYVKPTENVRVLQADGRMRRPS